MNPNLCNVDELIPFAFKSSELRVDVLDSKEAIKSEWQRILDDPKIRPEKRLEKMKTYAKKRFELSKLKNCVEFEYMEAIMIVFLNERMPEERTTRDKFVSDYRSKIDLETLTADDISELHVYRDMLALCFSLFSPKSNRESYINTS